MFMEEKLLDNEKVEFHPHVSGTLEKLPKDALFVVDGTLLRVDPRVSAFLHDRTYYEYDAREENKTLQDIEKIYGFLFQHQENQALIALGGGITGDVAGFAAATFKRGIPFIMVPTTLLSMCDSAVGGKCGVNYKGVKNYIGTFRRPDRILISSEFLETLGERELRSGLGEILKYGLIGDPDILKSLLEADPDVRKLPYGDYIRSGLLIKAKLVQEDYLDQGIRNVLNFGHNVGHALESLTSGELTHGESVALGILVELELSKEKLGLDPDLIDVVRNIMEKYSMMVALKDIHPGELLQTMRKDKKNDRNMRFTLLKRVGEPVIKVEVREEEILQALTIILE